MPSEDIKLPFSTVKDPRDLCVHRYYCFEGLDRGEKSYRGGRMRLGEIEFAIIPSEECGVEELYSDDIPRLLPFLRLDM